MSPPAKRFQVPSLIACHCCGLVHRVPTLPANHGLICSRCQTRIFSPARQARSSSRTAAIAAAALILYFPAILLPILQVEKLGHFYHDSLVSGVFSLLTAGQWFVGLVVLVFSIVLPPAKLLALFVLSTGGMFLQYRHRAQTYHLVELLGRWGMLDVLLVAILVAFVKLGDLIEITPGPGLLAFALCVLLSLCASVCFDPHCLWQEES